MQGFRADFRVKYRLRTLEEGGRRTPAFQGIRWDFCYKNQEAPFQYYMIWPEFEDEKGNIILSRGEPIPSMGTARMWVINDVRRPYHYDRVRIGVKCHFYEGGRKIADCEIIEVLDLIKNPVSR